MNKLMVIMAGGKGTRLKPLTDTTPKPLLELGGVPIIKRIMGSFPGTDFIVSLGHKAGQVKEYCETLPKQIEYIEEESPLGTAGALSMINSGLLNQPLFVTNCDILVNDFSLNEMMRVHLDRKCDLTIVGTAQYYDCPYGVMTVKDEIVIALAEKPRTQFNVMAGLYLISPDVLDLIPEDRFFDMPDLIHAVMAKRGRIGHHHISSTQYIDIGQLDDYRKAVEEWKRR